MNHTVVALRHVAFEDLGSLEAILSRRGYEVRYVDACVEELEAIDVTRPALLCILGGPIGATAEDRYPRVLQELALVRQRIHIAKPLLGICLGAQLMARAAGAQVYGASRAEIGWEPLALTDAGRASCLAELGDRRPMMHWHGDTFDIPAGATLLASTTDVRNQAFALGSFGLALQFHAEFRTSATERWLVGHAHELAVNALDVARLREECRMLGPALEARAGPMFSQWMDSVGL